MPQGFVGGLKTEDVGVVRHWLVGLFVVVAGPAWAGPSADGAYVPPASPKALADTVHPLPQADAGHYLGHAATRKVYRVFAGKNAQLLAEAEDSPLLEMARPFAVDVRAADLLGDPLPESQGAAYVGAVTSVDAWALRLSVDLSPLAADEEVWVIDPISTRAFGPYTARDHAPGGRWLATIEGDTAVLVARSTSGGRPDIRLTGVAHFFRSVQAAFTKLLDCNINIACETSPGIQQLSSGVGLMLIGSTGACSGTLLNNPDTPNVEEPYFMTANHCVPDGGPATSVEVIWDYRATQCGTNDPPALGTLPRSNGVALLATNANLDCTLLQLDQVPSGSFGRFYAGWTTDPVTVNQNIIGIHHPQFSHMRISYGVVTGTNVRSLKYSNQIGVQWAQGVTEGGSSGSGLFDQATLRYVGNLSNGTVHNCNNPALNTDNYGNFRLFFPQGESWLTGNNPPPPPTGQCPAQVAFKDYPEVVANLRQFRDEGLRQTVLGQVMVEAYYAIAPTLARWVGTSPQARGAFQTAAAPFATVGGWLK